MVTFLRNIINNFTDVSYKGAMPGSITPSTLRFDVSLLHYSN